MFRRRDGRVFGLGAVCPHRGGPIADGQTDATGRRVPAAPQRVRASALAARRRATTRCPCIPSRWTPQATSLSIRGRRRAMQRPTRPSHQLQTRQRSIHKPRTPPAPSTPRSIKRPTRRTFHDDRSHLRGAAVRRAHRLWRRRPRRASRRPTTASTGSRTGARRTRSSGQTTGCADRQAQPDLLGLLRAHRVLGLEPVVGDRAVHGPGVGHRPGRKVPAHRATRRWPGPPFGCRTPSPSRSSAVATGRSSARCCC